MLSDRARPAWKTRYFSGIFALIPLVLAACGGGGGSAPTPTAPAPASMGSLGSSSTKPTIKGLVTMGAVNVGATSQSNSFEELHAHPGVYVAAVINLDWSQLEPAQGVFDDSALTAALASIASYNANYPATPVVGKLRIFAGRGTPAWVIQATGGVTLTDANGSGTAGEFWTPTYRQFWQGLQTHLASEFDSSPAIGEVAISSCSTITAEPFILPHDAASVGALHQAGYTDALGMACLSGAAADYAAWKNTPLDFTFNAFTQTDSGNTGINTAFPITVMQAFRAALGTRGVVANHGLQSPLDSGALPIYNEFGALSTAAAGQTPPSISPLEFQTLSPTVDWPSAITLGLTYHPTEIEIWDTTAAGGQAPLSLAQLQSWASAL